MKKKALAFALVAVLVVLPLSGCSLVDGMTGADMTATDDPTWYHVGTIIVPFVSGVAALVRRFFGV